ncbi:MAG: DUF255 domain-containing protein [Phycisphaerae bacterium]|nr:DUF255 domain-containing protein [Phycisphaerae bacterium]
MNIPGPHSARPTNRLSRQSSPYLRQHAHNPVDWFPWSEEAFEQARRRDVPIFLSVGYSTCYWCHVMERESFEDPVIAAILNRDFVNVKVDREERPDVDDLYMTATQLFTGHGGWPMSVFLEPGSLRPFFAGTYYPPEPSHGRPSFRQLLEGMHTAWLERRNEVAAQAAELANAVRERLSVAFRPVSVGAADVSGAASALLTMFDSVNGGFGAAPKFPQPSFIAFLLAVRARAADQATRAACERACAFTLERIARGGIHDHLAGGFHRYSVDAHWVVPHFEKMLYDQALLLPVFARAALAFEDSFFAETARRTAGFVLREMAHSDGGFFSALDAEVGGREGRNYLWSPSEMRAVLGPEEFRIAAELFGLSSGPNFRDPHHPDEPPSNVLVLPERPRSIAARLGLDLGESAGRFARIVEALRRARDQRPQPRRDDKVLTAWNGLMIAGLADAGTALKEPEFLAAAERAADFALKALRRPEDGGWSLVRSWREGPSPVPAVLEDYAFLAHGLLALDRAGAGENDRYRAGAVELLRAAEVRFSDPAGGGYFDSIAGRSDLFVRPRSTYDGAVPSASAVMLHNWIDLHERTGDRRVLTRAHELLASLSRAIAESPIAAVHSTLGLLRLLDHDPVALSAALPPPAPREHDGNEVPPPPPAGEPVQVYAEADELVIPADRPVSLALHVRVAPGYHVNSADPQPDGIGSPLIPLRVGLTDGAGLAVYADYPLGEALGVRGEVRVYRGSFMLPVVIERSGAWAGSPRLTLTYQACSDTECMVPTTVKLGIVLTPD